MNSSIIKSGMKLIILLTIFLAVSVSAAEKAGKVVTVNGLVLLRNENDPNSKGKPVQVGDEFEEGAIINSSSGGSAKLLMSDRTIIDLGPSTLFKVSEFKTKNVGDRQVDMSMDYGKIRASVNKPLNSKGQFNIRTKTATMGVRGTEFVVAAGLDNAPKTLSPGAPAPVSETQITVLHGEVATKTESGSYSLPAGSQITTGGTPGGGGAKGEPPKVVKLSAEQMTAVSVSSKQNDTTFVNAVNIENNSQNRREKNSNESGGKKEEGGKEGGKETAGKDGSKDGPKDGNSKTAAKPSSDPINTTLAAIVETIAAAPIDIQNATLVGVPGVIGPATPVINDPNKTAGSTVNLKVTFRR